MNNLYDILARVQDNIYFRFASLYPETCGPNLSKHQSDCEALVFLEPCSWIKRQQSLLCLSRNLYREAQGISCMEAETCQQDVRVHQLSDVSKSSLELATFFWQWRSDLVQFEMRVSSELHLGLMLIVTQTSLKCF